MSFLPSLELLVETATGPVGLVVVFVYSFLVAFVLPLPGELVLVPASGLRLGVPSEVSVGLVILLSALGKTLGSLVALRIGRGATRSGPVRRLVERFPGVPVLDEGRFVDLVQRYGFAGMALLLAVPFTPDTATVYAFGAVETSTARFAVAAFVGTVLRLLITLALATGVLALI